MKKKLAVLLVAALTLGMTACGASKGAGDTGKSEKSMVYAVEAGSAGEEAAKEKGFQYNSVSSQAGAAMSPSIRLRSIQTNLRPRSMALDAGKDRIWLLISIRCLLTLIKTEAWKKLPKPTVFRKHL